jgi:hypothetical protein
MRDEESFGQQHGRRLQVMVLSFIHFISFSFIAVVAAYCVATVVLALPLPWSLRPPGRPAASSSPSWAPVVSVRRDGARIGVRIDMLMCANEFTSLTVLFR